MRGCAQRECPQVGADVQQRGPRAPSGARRCGRGAQAPQDLCTQAELPGSGVDDAAADYVALTAGSCTSERDSSRVSMTTFYCRRAFSCLGMLVMFDLSVSRSAAPAAGGRSAETRRHIPSQACFSLPAGSYAVAACHPLPGRALSSCHLFADICSPAVLGQSAGASCGGGQVRTGGCTCRRRSRRTFRQGTCCAAPAQRQLGLAARHQRCCRNSSGAPPPRAPL